MEDTVERILGEMPPVRSAFAYGSGAFHQAGYGKEETPMLDLVLIVEDAEAFHREADASHYSGLRALGPRVLASVTHAGCGVYYNPYVELGGRAVKYGVVEERVLEDDLQNWSTLFLAGRLHKPVAWVGPEHSPHLSSALRSNLDAATDVAWILLSAQHATAVDDTKLFETIAGLSYMGDPRFALGAETPGKVANIVSGNMDGFQTLYTPILSQSPLFSDQRNENGEWELLPPPSSRDDRPSVPKGLGVVDITPSSVDALAAAVVAGIRGVVGGYGAKVQIAKGVLTAGLFRSVKYGLEKLAKGRKR